MEPERQAEDCLAILDDSASKTNFVVWYLTPQSAILVEETRMCHQRSFDSSRIIKGSLLPSYNASGICQHVQHLDPEGSMSSTCSKLVAFHQKNCEVLTDDMVVEHTWQIWCNNERQPSEVPIQKKTMKSSCNCLIILCGADGKEKVTFLSPRTFHHVWWMYKAIYIIIVFLFQHHFSDLKRNEEYEGAETVLKPSPYTFLARRNHSS